MAEAKTLKQCGVPFGARIWFRVQWAPFIAMCLLLVCTLPLVLIWGLFHDSADDFVEGLEEVLLERKEQIKAHRARLIRLYAAGPSEGGQG